MRRKPTKRPVGRPAKVPVERAADPAYLTIDEFCVMFAISRASWAKHRPFLQTVQFGGRTLIPREEINRYVASLTKPAQKTGAPRGLTPPATAAR